MKIQAFHKPNANSDVSDTVTPLQLTIINYLSLWCVRANERTINGKIIALAIGESSFGCRLG